MTRKDIIIAGSIGFLSGVFLIFIFQNINVDVGVLRFALPLIIATASIVGLFAAFFLAKIWNPIWQFAKFLLIGGFNTIIDFGILNILITVTDIDSGIWYSLFVSVGFSIAVINSYFWNRLWVFKTAMTRGNPNIVSQTVARDITQFGKFILVAFIGLLINAGIASLIVNGIGAPPLFNTKLWANIGKAAATAISLIWNFTGYKMFVFKKKK